MWCGDQEDVGSGSGVTEGQYKGFDGPDRRSDKVATSAVPHGLAFDDIIMFGESKQDKHGMEDLVWGDIGVREMVGSKKGLYFR